MINQKSVEAVNKAVFDKYFVKPLYGSYCLSNIPQTVLSLFTAREKAALPADTLGGFYRQYDKIIFILFDSFGWIFFEKYKSAFPILREFSEKGIVSKLTSQFPSSTVPCITTTHTGTTPLQHGLLEWWYYEPLADDIVSPFRFNRAGDVAGDTLFGLPTPYGDFFPKENIYMRLKSYGVDPYIYNYIGYSSSPYNMAVVAGANPISYKTVSEGLVNAKNLLLNAKGKKYLYFYNENFDSMNHKYGPDSEQSEAEVGLFFYQLEKFVKSVKGKSQNTLLILTADHGQSLIDQDKFIYINRRLPQISDYIRKNKQGNLLVPAGLPTNMFLYLKEGKSKQVQKIIRENMDEEVYVFDNDYLVSNGFYGIGKPSKAFEKHRPDLVLIPKHAGLVWWENKDVPLNYFGLHGSLYRKQMEIPFICYPL